MEENSESPSRNPSLFLLRLLCILSFIGSGLGVFTYGTIALFFDIFKDQDFSKLGEEETAFIKMLVSGGPVFFFLSSMLFAISLTGAILMWNLRKLGFHLYATAQILLLIMPLIFFESFNMPGLSIWITLIFIFGYAIYLKVMK